MARMAAFLMWSGVGKSGSPGPKSAISTPLDFNFSASAITAEVGETWMRLIRSVSCTAFSSCSLSQQVAGLPWSLLYETSRNFRSQSFFNDRRHKSLQGTAELGDLAHQLRTQVAIGFAGQHKYGFQAGFELAIHQCHLQFVFVVGDSANPAQDHAGMALARIVNEQAVEDFDFNAGPLPGNLAQHFDALRYGKERSFFGVAQHGNDQQVKHFFPALD